MESNIKYRFEAKIVKTHRFDLGIHFGISPKIADKHEVFLCISIGHHHIFVGYFVYVDGEECEPHE